MIIILAAILAVLVYLALTLVYFIFWIGIVLVIGAIIYELYTQYKKEKGA